MAMIEREICQKDATRCLDFKRLYLSSAKYVGREKRSWKLALYTRGDDKKIFLIVDLGGGRGHVSHVIDLAAVAAGQNPGRAQAGGSPVYIPCMQRRAQVPVLRLNGNSLLLNFVPQALSMKFLMPSATLWHDLRRS